MEAEGLNVFFSKRVAVWASHIEGKDQKPAVDFFFKTSRIPYLFLAACSLVLVNPWLCQCLSWNATARLSSYSLLCRCHSLI